MAYDPGHDYFVRVAAATSAISTTTGLVSGAPALADAFDIGYTSPGAVVINDNTRKGYASGRRSASYGVKGRRVHTMSVPLRIGSGEFIQTYCAPSGNAVPELDMFYGISGAMARAIYRARCNTLDLNFTEGDNNPEVTANAEFWGRAYQAVAPVTLGYDYAQFGPALTWTDAKSFLIGATQVRDYLMGMSVQLNQNLELKGIIGEYGNNAPGSRCPIAILPHHKAVTGSFSLHDLRSIESTLFYGAIDSMNWGDITIPVSNVDGSKTFNVTITNPEPVTRSQSAIESSAQMQYDIAFVADDLIIEAVDDTTD